MLATVALFGICTAYLVSSGPVGIRQCDVLCDRDCSCSAPSYDSRQMTCNFKLKSGVPATWNGMKCSSGSCRAVQARHGTVICVNQHSNLVKQKKTEDKSLETAKKTSERFEIQALSKGITLSKKGFQVRSIFGINVLLERFRILKWVFTTPDRCRIYLDVLKLATKIQAKAWGKYCKNIHSNVEIGVGLLKSFKVNLSFLERSLFLIICPRGIDRPCYVYKKIETGKEIRDLAIKGKGVKIIVKVRLRKCGNAC